MDESEFIVTPEKLQRIVNRITVTGGSEHCITVTGGSEHCGSWFLHIHFLDDVVGEEQVDGSR